MDLNDFPTTLPEFQERFGDDEACLRFLRSANDTVILLSSSRCWTSVRKYQFGSAGCVSGAAGAGRVSAATNLAWRNSRVISERAPFSSSSGSG
jgi:hypothetical protein